MGKSGECSAGPVPGRLGSTGAAGDVGGRRAALGLQAWTARPAPRGPKPPRPLTFLGGSKSGQPGGVEVAGVLDVVGGRVVGVDVLGVGAGVDVEGVDGVDGQGQLKISKVQFREQFT